MNTLHKYSPPKRWARTLVQGLVVMLTLTSLQAQYTGGPGDGFTNRIIVQVTFDGIPAASVQRWLGRRLRP